MLKAISEIASDRERLESMRKASIGLKTTDAAGILAAEVLKLAANHAEK